MATIDEQKIFGDAVKRLDKAVKSATKISEANIGVPHTGRQNRALFMFAKLISHDLSILAILAWYQNLEAGSKLLDHFSIAALGRTSIDASLMTMYLSYDKLSLDEWNLRRHVLYLHDLVNRKRFLVASDNQKKLPFFENYEEMKTDLKAKIAAFALSAKYDTRRIEDLLNGQTVFVDGVRGAVREAGWDVQQFEFQQSYLSAYVHSHPVSFMRAEEYGISFANPSGFQFSFCGFVMEMVSMYLEEVTARITTFAASESADPLGHVE